MTGKTVEFNGEIYIRNPKSRYYFKHTTRNADRCGAKQLHRAVWEYYNGTIPAGWQVHHIDGDIDNNDISNLECLPRSEHLARHAEQNKHNPDFVAKQTDSLTKARDAAKEWHRQHAAESIGKVRENRISMVCEFCGMEFDGLPWSRFCCQSCMEKARRRRIGLKFEPHETQCAICGSTFIAKNASAKYCSPKCRAVNFRRQHPNYLPRRS